MTRHLLATAWRPRGGGAPSNRSITIAVTVGFALRLVWAVLARHTPTGTFNDAAAYLQMATDFSSGKLPTLAGRPSAFYAPGYPLLLSPFMLVSRVTGVLDPPMVASLVNVVAGTATIALTARLATRWISPAARNPAAWLMAIAPAHIYFTPTAHGETVFAALLLLMVLWMSRLADRAASRNGTVGAASLVLFGLLVPPIALVRGPGVMLFLGPAMVLRATHAGWRQIGRATALTAAGGILGLTPNLLLNGIHAGVWTPVSTQNATAFCVGHHEQGDGRFPLTEMPAKMAYDCYRYSPFDDPALGLAPPWWTYNGVDEARWYRATTRRGISYAAKHPVRELWLTKEKMIEAWSSEWDALPASRSYHDAAWTGSATTALNWIANAWLYLVEALVVVGLIVSKRCRSATPIWGSALLITLSMVAGLAQPHFRHGAMPFLVIIAAATVVEARRFGRSGSSPAPLPVPSTSSRKSQ